MSTNVIKVKVGTLCGVTGGTQDIEVTTEQGISQLILCASGMPEHRIQETKVRVWSALRQAGYKPKSTVVVNIPMIDKGTQYVGMDLAIVMGILAAHGIVSVDSLSNRLFLAELSLDGLLRPVNGVLPVVASVAADMEVIVARANADEVSLVKGACGLIANDIGSIVGFLAGQNTLTPVCPAPEASVATDGIDMADVAGQAHVKRALEIAAAGGHSILMIGAPGSGKTMMARRLGTILPPMTDAETLETTINHSVAGLMHHRKGLVMQRPFRAPHHTCSSAALIGGGINPHPGEVSLAHNGVLFIDELPEWRREVLESLSQAAECQEVDFRHGVTYPAKFQTVYAMNPCPCGYSMDSRHTCTCTPNEVSRYRNRIKATSDLAEIHVEAPAIPFRDLATKDQRRGESSATIRERVIAARALLAKQDLTKEPKIPDESKRLLEAAVDRLGISMPAVTVILRLARTIAALDGSEVIRTVHVAEAIQYRLLDRTSNF